MQGINILVVEDEDRMRDLLRIYLEKEGYTVHEASDGSQAMMNIENKYELILLDVMLPQIDGWTICREVRKKSNVPIIMITARAEEYDRLYGFELGVDDYIIKPFSPREVIARIKAVLKRSLQGINKNNLREITIEDILIDLESKQVFIDNKEVILTPKEYDLLVFLVKNTERVFSREQLLNNVWGYDFYGDTRTVDTHVKQLREKLGKEKNYIKTVWGTGYRFSVGD